MKPISVVIFALTLLFVIQAFASKEDSGSHYYYYYKQMIPLIVETQSVAVYDESPGSSERLSGLLAAAGHPDAELRSFPVGGWTIASIQSASGTPSVSGFSSTISRLIDLDHSRRYFFSPVFSNTAGEPVIITPSILVRFENGTSESRISHLLALAGAGGAQKESFGGMENSFRLTMWDRSGFRVLEVANRLAQSPGVIYAEPNMVLAGQTSSIPNDPLFPDSWGLHNTGQKPGAVADVDMDVPEAWDKTAGIPSIIIVVIDTGVQQNHPDINQIPGNDFVVFPVPTVPGDGGPGNKCDNHGTPVAGIISGIINNSIGTVGVAPNARTASARAIVSGTSCDGGVFFEQAWLVNALQWAEDIDARVTNSSFTVKNPSSALTDKFQETYNNGIVHFAGAGNKSIGEVAFPAVLSSVNAVSSVNWDGQLSSFSSFGPEIAFSAPGSQIRTTDRTGDDGWDSSDYVIGDGTSFSSPMAAGVAALILSISPNLTPPEIEAIMRSTAVDLGTPGWDELHGLGASERCERHSGYCLF